VDSALRGYTDKVPLEYAEFSLIRSMGWTYTELDEQPADKIELAFLFLQRENAYQKSQA